LVVPFIRGVMEQSAKKAMKRDICYILLGFRRISDASHGNSDRQHLKLSLN